MKNRNRISRLIAPFIALSCFACGSTSAAEPTDNEIRDILVRSSIAMYNGACACPESVDGRGQTCGERSAYKKEGSSRVLCYRKDVKDEMIKKYRQLGK